MKLAIKCIIALLILLNTVVSKLSPAEKKALLAHAAELDKSIDHIAVTDLQDMISQGNWLIFYGVNWCTITARYVFTFVVCVAAFIACILLLDAIATLCTHLEQGSPQFGCNFKKKSRRIPF